ncbi:GMC family oxidoreductase [Collimonas antrihumi]|uniref:GMC family oxidoreductase n=1 Tax=Collimonas antrihumi TaxID=1940615 RepID=UPI001B8C2BDD|nr:GMC family oxidoreductase [Collimonas antrihumi]
MIIDCDNDLQLLSRSCDIAIIGGGTVGLTIATSLSRAGFDTVVQESGGEFFESKSQSLNDAHVTSRPHAGIRDGRARVLGGTSTLWGGQLVRFSKLDLSDRPWANSNAWPITFSELTPYYKRVAEILGLAPYFDNEIAIWKRFGLTLPIETSDCEFFVTHWLKEPNIARHFSSDIRELTNLCVALHAHVTDIRCDEGSDSVSAISVHNGRGTSILLKPRVVIMANGTIEISRLLLLSAKLNPKTPWASNKWIDRGFQDCLDLKAAKVSILDKRRFGDVFDNIFLGGFKFQPKLRQSDEFLAKNGLLNIACSYQIKHRAAEISTKYLHSLLFNMESVKIAP